MMMVLSREAVKIMSGFSDDVAMAVTSPLCSSMRFQVEDVHGTVVRACAT